MTGDTAAGLLADAWRDGPGVVVARAGSPDPTVAADRLAALAERSFGDPLHLLVIPGDLHHVEREALSALAGAPPGFGQSSSPAPASASDTPDDAGASPDDGS
jgi:diphthine synthase